MNSIVTQASSNKIITYSV